MGENKQPVYPVKVKINSKEGQFLVRKNSINDLPIGVSKPISVTSTIDIMLAVHGTGFEGDIITYIDYEDFKNVFNCTLFALQSAIRDFLTMIGWSDNEWVRVDILANISGTKK